MLVLNLEAEYGTFLFRSGREMGQSYIILTKRRFGKKN